MGLIHNDATILREEGLSARGPVNGVGQQQIVVADLEVKVAGGARLQKEPVPTRLPLAAAELGDAHPLPVVAAEMLRQVQIQMLLQREQGLRRLPVLLT